MKYAFFEMRVDTIGLEVNEPNDLTNFMQTLAAGHQFIADVEHKFWGICVAYHQDNLATGRRPSVDYKEVLNAEVFAFVAKLGDKRKAFAEPEGVSQYARTRTSTVSRTKMTSSAFAAPELAPALDRAALNRPDHFVMRPAPYRRNQSNARMLSVVQSLSECAPVETFS